MRDRSVALLGELLDRHVVGHDEVKQALVLGLVCREHVYLEGPPGTAKTRMAELVARGSDLGFFFYQLHRDTRLSELCGDVVLERRPLPESEGGGERVHQRIEPGGLLTAEVCVLDDISRAPGEALNVLLRILNERKFGEERIPLLCAIATSNPMRDEYYNEPLDPANLDRFGLQLRVTGLLQSGDSEAAGDLVDRFADGRVVEQPEPEPVCDRRALDSLYEALHKVRLPAAVRDALSLLIKSIGLKSRAYESAESFLKAYEPDAPGCLLVDIRMPGMSGLEMQEKLNAMGINRPIIFMTGHGDVPMAVRAIRNGAIDFLTKPFNDQELIDRIHQALQRDRNNRSAQVEFAEVQAKLDRLTPREREVLDRIVSGQSNKVIAVELDVSERTVEVHRARVMEKTAAGSLAELVTMVTAHQVKSP